ncbi:MAG TPA: pyruvate, phosphate dikinase [Kofleriaceae bacterium]|nr:pyruvate, phosphate dikinase [Kofleriaceae bacterium]
MPRYTYRFGAGQADGRSDQALLLGGKGANLAEMASLDVPVPPGFTITTEVCAQFHEARGLPDALRGQVTAALEWMAEATGRAFGGADDPLLVSVRSGAPVSMPGMMDTILDLGLNDATVEGLARSTGDPRFAYDCYRRFVAMYGEIVMGVKPDHDDGESRFEELLAARLHAARVDDERELDGAALGALVGEFKAEILKRTGQPFPEDPVAQLWGAIEAVVRSWENPRAEVYRRMNGIDRSLGTAVTIQAMVFGNRGPDSCSGVCFTRNPATGEPGLYGELLWRAQGEDVVAGVRTPEPVASMQSRLPEAYGELVELCNRLEHHFADMQDIEFTVEEGRLWMLQTRSGKRSGKAMVRVAVDMVGEGVLDRHEAIRRIDPDKLGEVMHSTLDPKNRPTPLTKGLPASPGAAIGRVVFSANQAEEWVKRGETVILVRTETSPEDIHGMKVAAGIVTARGGMTSHAAVVARGMGRPCVTAATDLKVDHARERFTVGKTVVAKGDVITLDGSTGEVFVGPATLVPASMSAEFETLMSWVDEVRRLRVRTNADTPADARTARAFGAEGIGLCRTEHMFFAPERILAVREMILAGDEAGRRAALVKILPMQRDDFLDIFRAMDGLPVTIRLLDPPLHEFLPQTSQDIAQVAAQLGRRPEEVAAAVAGLHEQNPMLGHRGCRLAMSYPEIYETQTQAIADAALLALAEGVTVLPEIMIPFVSTPAELSLLREHVRLVFDERLAEAKVELEYLIGTMIELPRACLVGDRIAEHADFFSFGTNDLTQTVWGLSRDDSGRFLPTYLDNGWLERDPFVSLDRAGVGALIRIGVEKGRARKTKLKVGICGEHGGDPSSVEFCHVEGFDYVSCSPFRVPIARVAAARAALRGEARGK